MAETTTCKPQYIPKIRVVGDDPEWTGFASSLSGVGDYGYFSFKPDRSSVGVSVGISNSIDMLHTGDPWDRVLQLIFFIRFERSRYKVYRNGESISSWVDFNSDDTFHIVRIKDKAYLCESSDADSSPERDYSFLPGILFPGDVLHEATLNFSGTAYLNTYLYAVDDALLYAELHEYVSEKGATSSGIIAITGGAAVTDLARATGTLYLEGASEASSNVRVTGSLGLMGTALTEQSVWALGSIGLDGETGEDYQDDGVSAYTSSLGGIGLPGAALGMQYTPVEANGALSLYGYSSTTDFAIAKGVIISNGFSLARIKPDTEIRALIPRFTGFKTAGREEFVKSSAISTDSLQYRFGMAIQAILRLKDRNDPFRLLTLEIVEQALAEAVAKPAIVANILSGLTTTDASNISIKIKYADKLVSSGVVESYYHAVALVNAYLYLLDSTVDAATWITTDSINTDASIQTLITRVAEELESVLIQDTPDMTLTIEVLSTTHTHISDITDLLAHYSADCLNGVYAVVAFKTSGDLAQGWVVNTEGVMPASRYDNYEFSSLARIGTQYFATGDDGVYSLEGDTDAGDRIQASVISLLTDFGAPHQKRVVGAYLGYTSDKDLVLKVKSVDSGVLVENWYKATGPAEVPKEGYGRLGRGSKSRFWQFELVNVDGCDFEVNSLELHPLILSRRV